jgi:hypothetical protein
MQNRIWVFVGQKPKPAASQQPAAIQMKHRAKADVKWDVG